MPNNYRFKFHLLTGNSAQSDYNVKVINNQIEPYTFYLLENGIGYLGTTPLFGGGANKFVFINEAGTYSSYETGKCYFITVDNVYINNDLVNTADKGLYIATSASVLTAFDDEVFIANMVNYIADNVIKSNNVALTSSYQGNDTTMMTSKAITTFVRAVLSDVSVLQSSFFRTVVPHTLSQAEITAGDIHINTGDRAGDLGLLFTRDIDMTDDGNPEEEQFFVNLNNFITIYTGQNTNTITISINPSTFEITCNLVIANSETSILVDSVHGGIYLSKTGAVDDTTPSASKLVTEASLVSYINQRLENAVFYDVTTVSGDSMEEEEGEL